ncbi:MAG: hypothetical protein ABEJ42_09090 [Halobacteriaceae archaeon]
MQRRAAAVSAVVLLLVAAGAYVFIGVVEEPTVSVESTHELSTGDTVTVGDRTYTLVSMGGDAGTLSWTNTSARYTATFENNSTVDPVQVAWSGQTNRVERTLANGSTVHYNGTDHRVAVAPGETPTSFRLLKVAGPSNVSFAVGDQLTYDGAIWTVYEVTSAAVTLARADDPYRVVVENATDPTTFTFRQDLNVTRVLRENPAVENRVLRGGGERFVRYHNGSTAPLAEFLPEPETETFAEGDDLEYAGNVTTVAAVTTESVTLAWEGVRTNTVRATSGSNVTLSGRTYLAFVPDDSTLVLSTDFSGYRHSQDRIAYYHERVDGLWGVAILSTLAAVLLLAMAYLPSRY